jgi:hypothetical protein
LRTLGEEEMEVSARMARSRTIPIGDIQCGSSGAS